MHHMPKPALSDIPADFAKSIKCELLGCPNCLCNLMGICCFSLLGFLAILSIVNKTSVNCDSSKSESKLLQLSLNGIA